MLPGSALVLQEGKAVALKTSSGYKVAAVADEVQLEIIWNICTGVATFQLRCAVYAYFVAKMLKIAITYFGGHVQLKKYGGGRVRGFYDQAGNFAV